MNIKHIFFDLDHTLWDFDKNSKLTFQQLFSELKIPIKIDDFLKVYMPINLNYWRLYREEKIVKSDLRYARLKDTFDALKYSISDELIDAISENYINYLPKYNHLIEGALELLEYLYPKYSLHIITNGFKEVQNLKLEKSTIKKYFNVIVTSEDIGVKKPNSKIFEFSLKKANAIAAESVMIGDSYQADILGALKVGMLPIYCNFNHAENDGGVLSIKSLAQLKQYL